MRLVDYLTLVNFHLAQGLPAVAPVSCISWAPMANILYQLQDNCGKDGVGSHPALCATALVFPHMGQAAHTPLHSHVSPFEIVAYDSGAVHRSRQNLSVELTCYGFDPCSVRLLFVLKLPP